jgi:acyl carrier protein
MATSKLFILGEKMGMESVEMVIEAENIFQIKIGDDEAEAIMTVGEFRDCICKKLIKKNVAHNPHQVFVRVKQIVSEALSVPPWEINENSRFIEDLKMP